MNNQIKAISFKGRSQLFNALPMLYLPEILDGIQEVSMEQEIDPLLAMLTNIAAGDESAMAALYDATVHRLFGLAIKIVSKPEIAEEVIGDVYLQIWNKAKDFDSERAVPIAWMLMICRSRSLDKLRREKSAKKNEISDFDKTQTGDTTLITPYEDLARIELSSRVHEALRILNEKQRLTIILAFYKDMSHQEISHYTGEPLGTVKTNIRRAQLILRETLSREELDKGGVYGEA